MRQMKNAYIKIMIIFVFIVLTLFTTSLTVAAAADLTAFEAPRVRVVINGVAGSYTDVALEINDRIMLPFREVLTKLGVPNDDEHIIWNDEEESVTVLDGQNTVELQIGNYNMSVNGIERTFDVAPYFYEKNNRSYVPVRAVSELLDKQIMWEETTSTVYIRDKANYAETLDLLKKMQDAEKLTKIQATSESQINYRITTDSVALPGADEDGVLRASMDMSQLIIADLEKNVYQIKQVTNISNINIGSEMFFYDNRIFIKLEALGFGWQDAGDLGITMGAPVDQIMFLESQMGARPLSDVAMGIAVTKGSDGTYSITGEPISVTDINIILDLVSTILQEDVASEFEMKINKFQIGTTIDGQYNPVKAVALIDFEFSIKEPTKGGNFVTINFGADIHMSVNYTRLNPDFEIAVPQEIIDLI